MLLAIRDRMTGVVVWVICGLIIIPFALWGVQDYIGLNTEPAAVKFNDSEVSMSTFERRLQTNQQQLAQRFGGKIPEIFDNSEILKQQTLSQIVDREALIQYLQSNKYGSSAEQIYQNIASEEQFQQDGKFSLDTYERTLNSIGYTKSLYEQQMGLEIAAKQLQNGIQVTSLVSSKQLSEYVRLRNQKRDFAYFTFDITDYKNKVVVEDKEIADYYEANKASFVTERKVSLNYVEVNAADIAKTIEVDQDTLQALYNDDQIPGIVDKPESRKASHILLLVDETASDEELAAKKSEIEAIKERLKTEDFAALAKELSEDAGSAGSGGDLGDVSRGVMVKPFEDALFDMQENEISEVVKTQFGYHLIKLYKINKAQKPKFSEVKNKIAEAYKLQEAEKQLFEKADQLSNIAFEQPDNLDVAAQELGLEIKTTALFTQTSGTGLASHEAVREKAFSKEVLDEGLNSEAIQISDTHMAIVRIAEDQVSREKTLAEASAQIKAQLIDSKAVASIESDSAKALSSAKEKSLSLAAKAYGLSVENDKDIERINTEIDRSIVQEAFLISKNDEIVKVNLQNGSQAVLQLLAVNDGDVTSLSESDKQQVENEWANSHGASDYLSLMEAYKESADIVYHPDLAAQAE